MWMGIDGGGTHLRAVIVDDNLQVIATQQSDGANPNAIGQQAATERIQAIVQDVLQSAGLVDVSGVGVGIAGASARHSALWLQSTLRPVVPSAFIAPSSDEEIALVGARGGLNGVVLMAGTGSAAYGIGADGRVRRAGGWGYVLGDEGAGYWIGLQALRLLTLFGDGRLHPYSRLPQVIMAHIGITSVDEVIQWTYQHAKPVDIAGLAQVVLAQVDDPHADRIIAEAATHLAALATFVLTSLDFSPEALVFAGSLLTSNTALSHRVMQTLGLSQPPSIRYAPVIGAALLAKLRSHAHRTAQP